MGPICWLRAGTVPKKAEKFQPVVKVLYKAESTRSTNSYEERGTVGVRRVRKCEVWIMSFSSEKELVAEVPPLNHQPQGARGSGWDPSLVTHSH